MDEFKLLIGGKLVAGDQTMAVINPATEEVLVNAPRASVAQLNQAVSAAKAAFPAWSSKTLDERRALLTKVTDVLEANSAQLARLLTQEQGKPLPEAEGEIAGTVGFFRYWLTLDMPTKIIEDSDVRRVEVQRRPLGVVGAIIPWNFPLMMAVWKLGPALAAGCTVILKPAEDTPLTALRLAELSQQAGIPKGVINVVTGLGHVAGAALAAHPGVDKIAFTGSTAVGKLIGKAAVENMARVSLELGGKSPVIVLDDADPKSAAFGAANAIFFNSGQVCVAGSRLYVQTSKFDAVVEGVAAIAAKMRVGPGMDPLSQLGPLVSEKHLKRVSDYVRVGVRDGATLLAGGARQGDRGWYMRPTVLTGAKADARVVQEEIFGPVVVATPFDDVEEIAAIANATPYGLAASIWSNDLKRVNRLIPRIKAGTVWVNCHGLLDNALPFGGYKMSGFGREMGRSMMDLYTETKSVLMMV